MRREEKRREEKKIKEMRVVMNEREQIKDNS